MVYVRLRLFSTRKRDLRETANAFCGSSFCGVITPQKFIFVLLISFLWEGGYLIFFKPLLLKTFKASILCVFLNIYFGLEGFSFSVDSTQIFSLGKFLKSFLLKITL